MGTSQVPFRWRARRRGAGYTLVELLAVVALAGFVMAAVLPGLSRLATASLAERAVRQLAADIRVARARAVSRQEVTTVTVQLATHSYIVTPPGSVERVLPGNVTVAACPTCATEFDFDTRGLLADPAPVSFTVSAQGRSFSLAVTAGGSVQVAKVAP